MFPDPAQIRRRIVAMLGRAARDWRWRLAAAVVLACVHLAVFAKAGHDRLHMPFNSAPGQTPYFSDLHAPSTIGYPRQPHHWSRLIVSRLDAQHYIGTAVRGLRACPTDPRAPNGAYLQCGLGWLPAWGEVGGVVSRVTGIAPDYTLVLLAVIAFVLVNLFWTSDVIADRIGRLEAWGALLAFNMFPSVFHLVTPYTEAASAALVLLGFAALAKQRWILAGILVGASTALKVHTAAFAAALGCAALVAAWRRRKAGTARWWWPLLAIPLAGWGQLAEMAVFKITLGDWWVFWRARSAFGDPHQWSRVIDFQYLVRSFTAQNIDGVILFGVIGMIALAGWRVLKQFPEDQAVFLGVASVLTIVLSVLAPLMYWGTDRYLLLCPLAFLCMGSVSRRHTAVFVIWLFVCATFYWHLELCSYIAQGNPRVCHDLGRIEYAFPFGS